jgi:hypothetical protein
MGSRRLLLLFLPILLAVTGCSLLAQSDAQVTKDCEEGFWDAAKEDTGYTPSAEDRAKVAGVCAAIVASGIRDPDDSEALNRFILEHPEQGVAICEATAPALYSLLPAEERRYVTVEHMKRLSAEGCRYTIAHHQVLGSFDLSPLFKQKPELVSPFCVAGSMGFYEELSPADRLVLPRQSFEKLTDRVCREAIREGIVDFSSGNYVSPGVDQSRMAALYAKTIAKMRASGELPKPTR